jgi:hypothetical protein
MAAQDRLREAFRRRDSRDATTLAEHLADAKIGIPGTSTPFLRRPFEAAASLQPVDSDKKLLSNGKVYQLRL